MTVLVDVVPEWLALEHRADDALPEVLPDAPDWLLEAPLSVQEPAGECCVGPATDPLDNPAPAETGFWAVPGVTGLDAAPERVVPSVGALVTRLADLVGQLSLVRPADLPAGQALGEAQALARVQHELRAAQLSRTADVERRTLYAHLGFHGIGGWQRSIAPDAPAADRRLAGRLADAPHLARALHSGVLSFHRTTQLAGALAKVRSVLDRPDGLIDGRPGDQTLAGIGEHLLDVLCKERFGVQHDPAEDPVEAAYLAALEADIQHVLTDGGESPRPSQRETLERLLVLLGTHVRTQAALKQALEDIGYQLLPTELEEQEEQAQDKRALALSPNSDGTWHLEGPLTPEVGEQLFTALAAEARRDPANPLDTHARAKARALAAEAEGKDGWAGSLELPAWEARALNGNDDPWRPDGPQPVPRSRSTRLHDALGRLLTRYLGQGLGGVRSKVPVQLSATISHRTIENAPGAPPARGASGRPLARSVIRRWWCDAHVTTLVMSAGWKPLGVVHSARTPTATEWNALLVQYDNRCAGEDCCAGTPNPLVPLVPHHVLLFSKHGRTSLGETIPACPVLHDDIHLGKKTIRLRDGRLINEDGYLSPP